MDKTPTDLKMESDGIIKVYSGKDAGDDSDTDRYKDGYEADIGNRASSLKRRIENLKEIQYLESEISYRSRESVA